MHTKHILVIEWHYISYLSCVDFTLEDEAKILNKKHTTAGIRQWSPT